MPKLPSQMNKPLVSVAIPALDREATARRNGVLISIAIPAYNEEAYIRECLESLSKQTLPRDQYEVIVVIHEGSSDKTTDICKEYPVKIFLEKPGIGLARWRGFKEATGDILAGTDADTLVPPNWLEIILDNFKDPEVVSLVGPILTKPGATYIQRLAFSIGQNIYFSVGRLFGRAWMAGMNFAVRRSAYEACGGFDAAIKSAEDTDLTNRIRAFGKTKYDSRLKVYTSTRRLKEGYLKSFFRYSWNLFLLLLGKEPPTFPHYR